MRAKLEDESIAASGDSTKPPDIQPISADSQEEISARESACAGEVALCAGTDARFDAVLRQLARGTSLVQAPSEAARGLVGTTLGRYRIDEFVGAGGMGVVYRATDLRLTRTVALKVLSPGAENDPNRRMLLLREARSAAAISHPNVAAVYDAWDDPDGVAFIAMEYVHGQALSRLAAKGLTIGESLRIALSIASGLSRAHSLGIVHRDLKPDNVMVAEDGTVKILDFGLAKPLSNPAERRSGEVEGERLAQPDMSLAGRIAGTPRYMAPEQAAGGPVDARADVYAFGVLFGELLTARPFEPSTIGFGFPPRVPTAVRSFVARCLAAKPDDRLSDGSALAEALSGIIRRASWWPRLARVAFATLVVAAVAATGARFAMRSKSTSRPTDVSHSKAFPVLKRLTANPLETRTWSARLSRDAKTLVFIDARGMFLLDLQNSTTKAVPLNLLPNAPGPACAEWMPDGEQILVSYRLDSSGSGAPAWIVSRTGNILRHFMFAHNVVTYSGFCPRLSPAAEHVLSISDGRQVIVYALNGEPKFTILATLPEGEYVADAAWSPDSRWIVFVSWVVEKAKSTLHAVRRDGSGLHMLVHTPPLSALSIGASVVWAHNNEILYSVTPSWSRHAHLMALSVDPQHLTPVGEPYLRQVLPATFAGQMSTDETGTQLAALLFEASSDVFVAPIVGNGARLGELQRETLSERWEHGVAIAPDGSAMLVASEVDEHLALMRQPIGRGLMQPVLSPSIWAEQGAFFDNRGDFLAFAVDDARNPRKASLLSISLGSSKSKEIWSVELDENFRGWSRHFGPALVRCTSARFCVLGFRRPDGMDMLQIDPDSGATRALGHIGTTLLDVDRSWALSPDGRRIAVAPWRQGRVLVYQTDGPPERSFEGDPGCRNLQYLEWSPKGDELYASGICETGGPEYRFWRFDANGRSTTLHTEPDRLIHHPLIFPNGKKVALSLMELKSDVWLLR